MVFALDDDDDAARTVTGLGRCPRYCDECCSFFRENRGQMDVDLSENTLRQDRFDDDLDKRKRSTAMRSVRAQDMMERMRLCTAHDSYEPFGITLYVPMITRR